MRTRSLTLLSCLLAAGQAAAYKNTYTCPGKCTQFPTVLTTGGAPQSHAEVVPIFWGPVWTTNTYPTQAQIVAAAHYIVDGPYTDGLAQYGNSPYASQGIGPTRLSAVSPINSSMPPASYGFTDAQTMINGLIGAGQVPPPGNATNMIYTLFVDPKATSSITTPGWNEQGTCDASCGSFSGAIYQVAIIHTGANLQSNSKFFAHELAEAMTRNVVFDCGTGAQQVADLCECYSEVQAYVGTQFDDNITVEPYWSQADGACVIPESWTYVWQYNGSGSWTKINNNVRQIAAGTLGLFAMYEDGSLNQYLGSPYSWGTVTPPNHETPATFAVGSSSVLHLSADGATIQRFDGSTWTTLPSMSISGMAAGALELVTDLNGQPWELVPSTSSWKPIGFPGDEFVVGSDWAAMLALDHSDVSIYADANPHWVPTGQPATALFAGGLQTVAARNLGKGVSAMTTSWQNGSYVSNGWFALQGANADIAVYGFTDLPLAILNPAESEVEGDVDPIGSTHSWVQIGGSAARLVGHGTHLYAVQGVSY